MSYNDILDNEITRYLSMDGRDEHLQNNSSILPDLRNCTDALDLLFRSGHALKLNEETLKQDPSQSFEVSGAKLSYATILEMIEIARSGREASYAPYSHFNVGAAILAVNRAGKKKIFAGCNVENAAYGSTICAERTCAFKAVSEGFRIFRAYAVVGGFDDSVAQELRDAAADQYIAPCGSCRQVTYEFDSDPCMVIIATDTKEVLLTTLGFLLPAAFGPKSLGVKASSYDRHNNA